MSHNPSSLAPHAIMQLAIASAKQAVSLGEVPIAAVLMDAQGHILATTHNHVETTQNPLAHAEMLALTEALSSQRDATTFRRRYFEDCTLAVTLEPCAMCMAALCHARVGTVIFGAYDPKSGGTTNGARVPQHMHFKPEILGGIEEDTCRTLLQEFFKALR